MRIKKDLLQLFFLLYSGLLMIIGGFMLISFPIGAYIVFNTEIGGAITHQYPINSLYEDTSIIFPAIEIGEVFILLWCIYITLFSILLFREENILATLISIIKHHSQPRDNRLAMTIIWFSILLIGSKIIDLIQQSFGIEMGSIKEDNLLIKFFNLTLAPLNEELLFRVLLIGLPAYLFINSRFSIKVLLKTLWHPAKYLRTDKIMPIILVSATIFGILHILTGWNYGKITQATFAGVILGFVYYKYGLPASIILHWSTNYFLVAYGLLTASLFALPWNDVKDNPLLQWLDLLLTAIGVMALSIYASMLLKRFKEKVGAL